MARRDGRNGPGVLVVEFRQGWDGGEVIPCLYAVTIPGRPRTQKEFGQGSAFFVACWKVLVEVECLGSMSEMYDTSLLFLRCPMMV